MRLLDTPRERLRQRLAILNRDRRRIKFGFRGGHIGSLRRQVEPDSAYEAVTSSGDLISGCRGTISVFSRRVTRSSRPILPATRRQEMERQNTQSP